MVLYSCTIVMCNSQYNSFRHEGLKLQFTVKLYFSSYTLHWDNVLKSILYEVVSKNVTNTNKIQHLTLLKKRKRNNGHFSLQFVAPSGNYKDK